MSFKQLSVLLRQRVSSPRLVWVFWELRRIKALPDVQRTLMDRLFLAGMPKRFERQCAAKNSYIYCFASIGDGTQFWHQFDSIHIAMNAVIGKRCQILHNVTIGQNITSDQACPIIGNDVFIGPGASIIGRCNIGDGCKIGAGVVLVNVDLPPGTTVINKSAYDLTNKRFVYPQD